MRHTFTRAILKFLRAEASAQRERSHAPTVLLRLADRELQLRPETLQLLTAPAIPAEHGFYDECMKGEMQFSLGFCKPGPTSPFGHPGIVRAPWRWGVLRFRRPRSRCWLRLCDKSYGYRAAF